MIKRVEIRMLSICRIVRQRIIIVIDYCNAGKARGDIGMSVKISHLLLELCGSPGIIAMCYRDQIATSIIHGSFDDTAKHILLVTKSMDTTIVSCQALNYLPAGVSGAIIENHNFKIRESLTQDAVY